MARFIQAFSLRRRNVDMAMNKTLKNILLCIAFTATIVGLVYGFKKYNDTSDEMKKTSDAIDKNSKSSPSVSENKMTPDDTAFVTEKAAADHDMPTMMETKSSVVEGQADETSLTTISKENDDK